MTLTFVISSVLSEEHFCNNTLFISIIEAITSRIKYSVISTIKVLLDYKEERERNWERRGVSMLLSTVELSITSHENGQSKAISSTSAEIDKHFGSMIVYPIIYIYIHCIYNNYIYSI